MQYTSVGVVFITAGGLNAVLCVNRYLLLLSTNLVRFQSLGV